MQEVAETRVARKAPSLRFSGFKGNWNEEKIGAGIDLVSGRHLLPDEYNNTGDGIAYFTGPSDLTNDIDHLTKWTKIVGNTGVKGDVLLTVKGSGVGMLLHLELDEAALGRQLMAIKSKRHSTGFLFQRLLLLQPYFEALASGNMIPGLSRPDILTTKVYFPTLPEQQKIAAFLGAVDRKIQQLKRKHELLERYKKGVVQQLFSQELRFKRKDGGVFPEWEETPFGDIYTFHNTNSLSRDKLNYDGGDVLNIHYGDIHTKFSAIFKVEKERVPYVNAEVDLSRVPEEQFCQPGDLVIADASEDLNDIGKTIEIASTDGNRIVAGLHTYLARPKKGSMAPGYGAYLMRSEQVREEIERLAHGSKVLSISRTHLNSIVVSLPSLEEQSRIAGFLMALDAKVAGVAQAVAAAQKWKKGLLQQMFV